MNATALKDLVIAAHRELSYANAFVERMYYGQTILKSEVHAAMTHLRAATASLQAIENQVSGIKPETIDQQ